MKKFLLLAALLLTVSGCSLTEKVEIPAFVSAPVPINIIQAYKVTGSNGFFVKYNAVTGESWFFSARGWIPLDDLVFVEKPEEKEPEAADKRNDVQVTPPTVEGPAEQ